MTSFSLILAPAPAEREILLAELQEAGTTGIVEDQDSLRAFFDATASPAEMLHRFARFEPRMELDEPHDWVRHSRDMWQPFELGARWFLVPEWLATPAPAGRLRLPMRPGMACGSGWHPATQLCLLAMEQLPAASLLDVGTGTGILAEAAFLLGCRPVAACDIEHDAAAAARQNLPSNTAVFTGSLRSIRDRAFDTIVANLNAATLATLHRELFRVARDHVIVSGFREAEAEDVSRRFGRTPARRLELEDWACLVF